MNPTTVLTLLAVAAAGFLIGLSKGGLGAPLVILVTPLLALVMPVPEAISLGLPLLLVADVIALAMYWRTWDMRYIRQLLPMAIVGIIIGTLLLVALPDLTLRRLLGVFTLSFVAYRLFGQRLFTGVYSPRPWHAWVAGGTSGLGSALANTGAPPYTAYMLLQPVSPVVFVGTTTLFFALVNLIKLPGLMLAGLMDYGVVLHGLWVVPIIVGGVFLGRRWVRRIDRKAFDRLMLAVLTVAGLVLLLVNPR